MKIIEVDEEDYTNILRDQPALLGESRCDIFTPFVEFTLYTANVNESLIITSAGNRIAKNPRLSMRRSKYQYNKKQSISRN